MIIDSLQKKKKERAQINKIRNERSEIKTNTTEIQKIIRNYYDQLYTNKKDSLQEMDRFREMHNLSRLNKKERENKNRPIKSIIKKNSPQTKVQDLTVELYQTFKEELSYPSQTIPKIEENASKLIFRSQNHSDTKTRQRHHSKRENCRPISLQCVESKFKKKILMEKYISDL